MSDPFQTVPSIVFQASAADLVWGCDTSVWVNAMNAGTPVVESVTLTNRSGVSVPLQDSYQLIGNVVYQRIRAGVLGPRLTPYTLTFQVGLTASTNQQPFYLTVQCEQ